MVINLFQYVILLAKGFSKHILRSSARHTLPPDLTSIASVMCFTNKYIYLHLFSLGEILCYRKYKLMLFKFCLMLRALTSTLSE